MNDFYEKVKRLYSEGVPVVEIERQTGKSRSAIMRAAKKLGLVHPNRDNRLKSGGDIITKDCPFTGGIAMEPTKAQLAQFRAHCEAHGLPYDLWRSFWHKTGEYSSFFVNKQAQEEYENQIETILRDISTRSPRYRHKKRTDASENLLVLPMADVHFGKWSSKEEVNEEYNLEIVTQRVLEGTANLVQRAKPFGVSDFVVCLGNDMLHTDNGSSTTGGTPQDNDGSWFANFRIALRVMRTIVEGLAEVGRVHLVFVPANHDWRSGFSLSHAIAASFEKHPNVSCGAEQRGITEVHRKYFVYGHNLIMFTHGDGAKEKDLHWLLATEAAEAWSKTTFRYVYLGHIHHKDRKSMGHNNNLIEKDKLGLTEINTGARHDPTYDVYIEYARSPSATDGWHHRKGYIGKQAVEAFLHHPTEGQIARFTNWY